MHDPPHPGEVLHELCLAPPGLSVSEAARYPERARACVPGAEVDSKT
jgi:plasmid maintenance system antidote protein VapI